MFIHSLSDAKIFLRKAGGAVIYDRVGGVLAVSRAFGDHGLTGFGVISVPDVMKIDLRVIHKYLVIASDGLWDVVLPKVWHIFR